VPVTISIFIENGYMSLKQCFSVPWQFEAKLVLLSSSNFSSEASALASNEGTLVSLSPSTGVLS